jgi:hypothetical protein
VTLTDSQDDLYVLPYDSTGWPGPEYTVSGPNLLTTRTPEMHEDLELTATFDRGVTAIGFWMIDQEVLDPEPHTEYLILYAEGNEIFRTPLIPLVWNDNQFLGVISTTPFDSALVDFALGELPAGDNEGIDDVMFNPEPTTLSLLALGSIPFLRRRWRIG